MKPFATLLAAAFLFCGASAQKTPTQKTIPADSLWKADNFSGLAMRSIGPALFSGRIADIAVHPHDPNTWYVAVGSGGVWKTENAATTWTPVFDNYSSYSTGCISIDPSSPSTVWLGTGENVGGRHAGFGDGVYRSADGGKSWVNMGLKTSEHISKIIIHPTNSNIVWVAAQGPLWSKGGERGVYKTTDGGKTWVNTLSVNEWTGATDLAADPRNPDVIYAATWQRHRTVANYMGGGPGSGIYRSDDGGNTWIKLTSGLPTSRMGKIGIAVSPQQPDVVYAAIELDQRTGAVFKSTDRGANFTKQSDAVAGATGPHYYQELYACPHYFDRIYLVDVRMQISDDGGKTFRQMKEDHKHSDNHALVFRKDDPNYLLVGTDGGLYESFDGTETWRYIANLPVTQFYKLALDDSKPFYKVFGGTQDNYTHGGPVRTDNVHGIRNHDWKIVLDWDGHQPATEPGNPDIMYGQRQEGTLSRIDMQTGEVTDIQPHPAKGEPYERFNWDAPILVSPHKPTRIYHASQRLWRSENRGDSWQAISADLTNNVNRMELPIMGGVQSWENSWDLLAMSNYSSITSIAESPLKEGLIYIGTDDGNIQVTENGGSSWALTKITSLPGVPATAFINDIKADLFDENTVYIALDNHKEGDFKPYLFKSSNRGKSWVSLSANLPERTLVWRIVQDHKLRDLFFIGTEFGLYFTTDGGKRWTQIKGGVPTISFRDLTIHRRDNDLVAASFGRSFYVFDDIEVFRNIDEETLRADATLFPVKDALWYIPRGDIDFGDPKGFQGASYFAAPNPAFGAIFTYHLGEGFMTLSEKRQKAEKEGQTAFPGWDALQAEADETAPAIIALVRDAAGTEVRRVQGPAGKGFHRIAWDLKLASPQSIRLNNPNDQGESGILAAPGKYSVQLYISENGVLRELSQKAEFSTVPIYKSSISNPLASETGSMWESYQLVTRDYAAVMTRLDRAANRSTALRSALNRIPAQEAALAPALNEITSSVKALRTELQGNKAKNKIGEKNDPTISDRFFKLYLSLGRSTYGPTPAIMEVLATLQTELAEASAKLEKIEAGSKSIADAIFAEGGPFVE
jgi:photosystem II stability/assembly factor-like uncharacterized protein